MRIITCGSPYNKGGLGQHGAQLIEEARASGALQRYYMPAIKPGDAAKGRVVPLRAFKWMCKYTPLQARPTWASHVKGEMFDRRVAAMLDGGADSVMAFVGKALHTFRAASRRGISGLELVAANSHINNVVRMHEEAARRHGYRDTWVNEAQRRKTLAEYEMADAIYVHTEYTRQSFLDEGIPAGKLKRTILEVDARFEPPAHREPDGTFRVVYVGRIDFTKGIPLLLEAFERLDVREAELVFVGGWATRSMREYMERWLQQDARIRMAPGDPVPELHQADVFVHPTYEDGFAYAPMEALACGVPVIVTEDTGMKEYVEEGVNGYVVPTGDGDALFERLDQIRRHPLRVAPARTSTPSKVEAGR
jgi:glycosyltransferase involved in cell wall biosynthesis